VLSVLHHALAWDTFAFGPAIGARPALDGAVVLVCEVSESIAGYLCLGDPRLVLVAAGSPAEPAGPADPAVWALRAFGVAPQFRHIGVATDLWRAALELVPTTITHVAGSTRSDLAAAVGWYEASGFRADATGATSSAAAAPAERGFRADVATLRARAAVAG